MWILKSWPIEKITCWPGITPIFNLWERPNSKQMKTTHHHVRAVSRWWMNLLSIVWHYTFVRSISMNVVESTTLSSFLCEELCHHHIEFGLNVEFGLFLYSRNLSVGIHDSSDWFVLHWASAMVCIKKGTFTFLCTLEANRSKKTNDCMPHIFLLLS